MNDRSPGWARLLATGAFFLALAGLNGCANAHKAPQTEAVVGGVTETLPEANADPELVSLYEESTWNDLAVEDSDIDADEEVLPGEPTSIAPHDLLAEISPELSEEVLEAERAKYLTLQPTFDIPIVTNKKVMGFVDYYANRNPLTTSSTINRSGRYLPMFRQIFAEAGLPQDLIFMAHVESAYKTSAYSRARARGVFQFISATGRRYGLRIDQWVDERADPEKSARAATAYLKDLHDEFGDWYLALAAYNAGEGRVRRAVRNSGSRDFWTIASSSRHLRRETRNYVPAIIAATMVSKEHAKYGLTIDYDTPIAYDSVKVEGAADLRVLAKCAGTDFETLRELNPALRRYQTPPGTTTDVRVPVGRAEQTLVALADVPQGERVLYARHYVASGDTLSKIASKYRVSVRSIQDSNNMGRSTMIRVGRTLVIPTVATGNYPSLPADSMASNDVVVYRVRRGDTLSSIARRYRTNSASIAAASGIRTSSTLSIGQRLKVVPGVRSTSQARAMAQGGGTATSSSKAASTYTVRRGDSLWKIANRHRTTVARLCSLNNISASATLRPGTRLALR